MARAFPPPPVCGIVKFLWRLAKFLGNGVTVARLTLDQLVGVQIPIPQ